MRLKVIYYNVWHGFHSEWQKDNPNKPFVFYPERLQAAKEAVKREHPDILVLGEAAFGVPFLEKSSGRTIHIDYQKEFQFPHAAYAPKGGEWGTSILSKYALKRIENLSALHRTFVRSEFAEPNLFLNVAHPHPSLSEAEKEHFLDENLSGVQKNCILVGDFNALSDQDTYDREQMISAFRSIFGESTVSKIDDMLQCRSIRLVRSKGLIDTFVAAKRPWSYTIPADVLSKYKKSGIRIDYIFCSRDFKIIDAGIIKNKLTELASDHYPVYAVLEI
jgi:endonuclease/exonuclease/phosphatase family metal-dependent hydrolase